MKAPLPPNESARLEALLELDILDTPPEERFDRITRLAAQLIDVPIVLISLVDEDRQWFKSRVGLDADQTHRDLAFCAHVILQSDVMMVSDAREDPRFCDNPLVMGDPNIRFYAGAPLSLSDGVQLGTLCAIDRKPRTLNSTQEQALQDLSRIVVDELKLRQNVVSLRETQATLEQRTVELEHSNGALEQFAHMAAHDLRAPMKTIINMSDIAMPRLDEQGERSLQFIRSAAVEMEAILEAYRRLAQLRPESSDRVAVSELLRRAQKHSDRPLDVGVNGDAVLGCDAQMMTQVFVNLLSNAERYSTDGAVHFDCTEQPGGVLIRVTNVCEPKLVVNESIFAPLRRLTTDGDGLGLGLAIVKRIVELHKGEVAASNDAGRFTFELRLPQTTTPA